MSDDIISKLLSKFSYEKFDLGWYSGKSVLVTGGAGFIGSFLVEALSRLGSKVFVADNLWRGSLKNLTRQDGSYWIRMPERFLYGDLKEYHFALAACIKAKPDIVFHLADVVAGVDYVFANEPFVYRSNLLINSNVYSAILEARIPRLVYLGTACSYPRALQENPGGAPLIEEQVYPAFPESSYGWSKLLGEYEAELVANNSEVQVGILRLHNVYGPRSILSIKRSQVIPSLIRKAIRFPDEDFIVWGSGSQARDFVFIADVLDALLRIPHKGMGEGPIQISTGKETTIAELAEMIVEISGKKIEIKFDKEKPEGDGGRSGANSKARKVLGWEVTTSIKDGLSQTYAWAQEYLQNNKDNFVE